MCSARQQLRVGGVAESLPSDEGARPAQRVALLAADGSVDVEAGDDVPDAARGEDEDGSGAVHEPGDGGAVVADYGRRQLTRDLLEVGVLEARGVRTHLDDGG